MHPEKHDLPVNAIVSFLLSEDATGARSIIDSWKEHSNLNAAFTEEYIYNGRLLIEYSAVLVNLGRPGLTKKQWAFKEALPSSHRKALTAVVPVLYETVVSELTASIKRKLREGGI